MNKGISKRHKAFTLAEVLVTLGIIGVIAAMTIPNLVMNYQKKQYSTQIKKAYAQMNQVLQQMAVDGGTIGDISQYFGSTTAAGTTIASYYKVVKNCGTTAEVAGSEQCFDAYDDNYDGSSNTTNNWTSNVSSYYKFVTSDGMSFAIGSYGNNCNSNYGFSAAPDSPTYNSTCGWVLIDVNGKKQPNNLGRDVFEFFITSNKTPMLYPLGGFYFSSGNTGTLAGGGNGYWNYNGTANLCWTNTTKYGLYCPGRLMEKGWEMDYQDAGHSVRRAQRTFGECDAR